MLQHIHLLVVLQCISMVTCSQTVGGDLNRDVIAQR